MFDTNVLVSALLWPERVPAQVVALARRGRIQSVSSPDLLEELHRVLVQKLGVASEAAEAALELVGEYSEVVVPRRPLRVVRADPEDNCVIECAAEGKADFIASGDHHLLALGRFRAIVILSPRAFLERAERLLS